MGSPVRIHALALVLMPLAVGGCLSGYSATQEQQAAVDRRELREKFEKLRRLFVFLYFLYVKDALKPPHKTFHLTRLRQSKVARASCSCNAHGLEGRATATPRS